MSHARIVTAALVAGLATAIVPPSHAASAGDAGPSLVIPLVQYDGAADSDVYVENHEQHDVEVALRWVGEPASSTPGLRICRKETLLAGHLTWLRPDQSCSLSRTNELGMLVILATKPSGVARLSARGNIAVKGGGKVMVDGLPLADLESTSVVHVASGLTSDPSGTVFPPSTTDCLFGTFFDGSGAGGALVRFGLRDSDRQPLGKDVLAAVKPFSLTRFSDVFKLVGAPPAAYDNVRAVFAPTGGGDAVVGYCLTTATTPQGETRAYTLARVDEPEQGTRRRIVSVASTPEAQGGRNFRIDPSQTQVSHGLFVQHPDRFRCAVGSAGGSGELVLTVVSPDGVSLGGQTASTGWLDTGPRGQTNRGEAGLWALEVPWAAGALRSRPLDYVISCESGNGVSLADELFRLP
jgi:hypothetical protein